MAYIYQADVWCDKCGAEICAQLDAEGKRPANPDDEISFDSDEYPKAYDAPSEEADSPENCASGTCGNDLQQYGAFLENQLTSDGYRYLKGMLDGHGAVLPPFAQEWADFYGFTFWKQPWDGPHAWLRDVASTHAANTAGDGATPLVSILNSVIDLLDADQIQGTFQQEMDDDGFFKETGWYSSEM